MTDDESADSDRGIALNRRSYVKALGALGAALGTGATAGTAAGAFTDDEVVSVGAGSYAKRKPMPDSSTFTEQGQENKYVAPSPVTQGTFLTDDADPTPQSNSWWSHNWFNDTAAAHGGPNPTIPLPWYTEATSSGLTAKYSNAWLNDPGQTQADRGFVKLDYRYTPHIKIGHSAGTFSDSRVDDWGDFHTRLTWGAGTSTQLDVTLVKGSPFIFAEYTGGGAELTLANLNGDATTESYIDVWADRGNVLGVTIQGIDTNYNYQRHYGIFAPGDATFSGVGTGTLTSDLGSGDYLVVAPLPSASTTTLDTLEEYAYNIVRDTQVSYDYAQTDANGNVVSEVRSTFSVTTEDKAESGATGTLSGLMPHQWKYSDAALTGIEYWSPRGTLKVHAGSSFQTTKTYPGVLPHLPDEGTYDEATLQSYVDDEEAAELWSQGTGSESSTYWVSKDFDHHLRTIPIAQQVGDSAALDRSLTALKKRLESWLTVQDTTYSTTEEEEAFAYWDEFGSLIGYPAEFYSSDFVNDHHFHYGYFVKAAAAVARMDGQFIDDHGGMVDLLVREYANWERPDGSALDATKAADSPADAFPYLRNFDAYEGHSWAAGFCLGDGNDQESSSEAMMANAAIIQWAEQCMARADTDAERAKYKEMRDTGIALYTEEMHAIWEYWFDNDNDSHPDNWGSNLSESETNGATGAPEGLSYDAYEYSSIVWGDGYHRQTFWGQSTMEEIWGINWLPIDGHSFYLNLDEAYADANYSRMVEARGGDTGFLDGWHTAAIGYRALSDPADAVDVLSQELPIGRKSAHIYHWAHNMNAMGTPNQNVVADTPQAQVFEDASGDRTYVAYNADGSTKTVNFSDGTSMDVPANALKTSNGDVTYGQRSGGSADTTPPAAPTNLASPAQGDTSVDLSWDASTSSDVAHYTVYVDGASDQTVTAGTTTATVSGLSSATSYDFSVTAVDDAGNESGAAGPISVSTESGSDTTAPAAPTNLTGTATSGSSVDLSWDASTSSDVAEYVVYVDGTQDQTVAAGTTSATVSGLSSGTTYDFSVTAVDDAGNESAAAGPVSVTTDSASSAPAVDSVSVTSKSNGGWARFQVDWAVSDADGDLATVEAELRQNGQKDLVTTNVGGAAASGTDRLQHKKGSGTYDVVVTVTDAAGNSSSQTTTVTA